MCLVAVRLQQEDGTLSPQPAFEDVVRIECQGDHPVIERMLDEPEVIYGRIQSVDLIRNEVVVEAQGHEQSGRP